MPPRLKRIIRVLTKILLGFLAVLAAYLLVLAGTVLWTFEADRGKWPMYVHGAPHTLRVGDDIEKTALADRLKRQGYVQGHELIPLPGEWSEQGSIIRIWFANCPFSGQGIVSGPVELDLDWKTVRSIKLMRGHEEVDHIVLEPELLDIIPAPGFGRELSRPLPLAKIKALLIDAVLLTEDPLFYSHSGIDPASMGLAVKANIKARRYVQGASTITQQLVRMTLLSPEKSLWRKLNEILIAVTADALYSKETILETYLNRVYFGHSGSYPVKGVAEAARVFFGKDQAELDPAECALLAALIRAPNVISPYRNPERAKSRRNVILGLLFKASKISREEFDIAVAQPVNMRKGSALPTRAPAFLAMVREKLEKELPSSQAPYPGQDVITSLDPLAQEGASAALKRLGKDGAIAHLILADPESGSIRVMLAPVPHKWSGEGGNLETILPLVTIPALLPDKQDRVRYSLTTPIFPSSGSRGPVTLRAAFNTERGPLIERLVSSVGPGAITRVAEDFGIKCKVQADKTITVQPVSPMQMVQVYTLLATLGNAGVPGPGIRIIGGTEQVLTSPKRRCSVNPNVLFPVNQLLKRTEAISLKDGAADKSSDVPSVFSAADEGGLWSVAYRRDAVLLLRYPDKTANVKKIEKMMAQILAKSVSLPSSQATLPEGIVFRKICVESGLLATSLCPKVITEPFVKGSQPVEWCPLRH